MSLALPAIPYPLHSCQIPIHWNQGYVQQGFQTFMLHLPDKFVLAVTSTRNRISSTKPPQQRNVRLQISTDQSHYQKCERLAVRKLATRSESIKFQWMEGFL